MKDCSIIILTKNAGSEFVKTLNMVCTQKYGDGFEVIIIDSGSTDKTVDIAKNFPARIYHIKPEEFGHGRTRNLGIELAEGKHLVFLTQDATPATNVWLANLIRNLHGSPVAGAYGRQIPKRHTKPMEQFFLSVQYPPCKVVRKFSQRAANIDFVSFSNVNSAIKKEIAKKYPFSENIIHSEDLEWAIRVLKDGYTIIYEPEAAVYHSHDFSLKTVFQRYFDIGVSWNYIANSGFSSGRLINSGLHYVGEEVKFLLSNSYTKWLPYAVLYDLSKFLGISLGKRQKCIPLGVKKRLSVLSSYWDNRS